MDGGGEEGPEGGGFGGSDGEGGGGYFPVSCARLGIVRSLTRCGGVPEDEEGIDSRHNSIFHACKPKGATQWQTQFVHLGRRRVLRASTRS